MRLDVFLAERDNLSRTRAANLIKTGGVSVNGKRVDKPSAEISGEEIVEVVDTLKFASLGGVKLENALDSFHVDLKNKSCLDVGAANGGFTDCMLNRGAERVTAVDLHVAFPDFLKEDARVEIADEINAKDLAEHFRGRAFDFISVDLSFISLCGLFRVFRSLLSENGELICLFKPQFEVGRKDLPKSGVVRDKKAIEKAFARVLLAAKESGLRFFGDCAVPELFEDKNAERTILFRLN